MEKMKSKPLLTFLVFLCLYHAHTPVNCARHVGVQFSAQLSDSDVVKRSVDNTFRNLVRNKRSEEVTDTESEKKDPSCLKQQIEFKELRESLTNGERLEETHVFANESKFNLALAWAGENDDGTLLVLTSEAQLLAGSESTLWRSTDHGRTWNNESSKVDDQIFRKQDGLQRNPHNPKKVYLISYLHFIYVTETGGDRWYKSELVGEEGVDMTVDEQLEFHPDPKFEDYVAVITTDRKLYVTYDNFQEQAKAIKNEVQAVKWGTFESNTTKCLFATTGLEKNPFISLQGPQLLKLERYDSEKNTWKTILTRVMMFDVQGKFMYASIYKDEHPTDVQDERLMMISSDGGNTWNEATLPTLTGDRFFSVLDMSEGLIFMHVDNPGDTGHGVLYTSSSDGLIYSESLTNHLFPNYNTVHDFYKVRSIRGVYLASQMSQDKSIHTVITYNRGGDWVNVSRPVDVDCENEVKEGCFLQIHSAYSVHRGINSQVPNSIENAVGLVLVHAHVASNLQTTPPDVFLSTDGGYNFKRVLKGPHDYQIADSGGLLVAIPLDDNYPQVIKFSTDEGDCWHLYKFTDQQIKYTGLLTEPGGKSMTVSVWGYEKDTKKWTVNVIDFDKVVTKQCKDQDYTTWIPHVANQKAKDGCLLGRKEVFKRVKKDSWCQNGYEHTVDVRSERCACSEDDYECDFGFYRPDASSKCVRQPDFKSQDVEICKSGEIEKLVHPGYRLVPGDECDPNLPGSFKPPKSGLVDLGIKCQIADAVKHDEETHENTGSNGLLIATVVIIVLVLVAVVGAFFAYKMVLLRRHKVVYRYSALNQTEDRDELENALIAHDTLYRDSSDEEVEQENKSPQHNGGPPTANSQTPPVRSFHDDSDDDMLA